MINLVVNGKGKKLDGQVALLGYLESLGVDLRHIAVAHNGIILRRDELSNVTLSDGDRVEIVRAVGGG